MMSYQYLSFHSNNPKREALLLNGGAACYNIYQTADARFIALAPLETKFWVAFCEAISKPEWIKRQSEALPQTSLIQAASELFKTKELTHWNTLFKDVDCCYEPILLSDEVAHHPQVVARDALNGVNPRYPSWINNTPVINEESCCDIQNNSDNSDQHETIKWL